MIKSQINIWMGKITIRIRPYQIKTKWALFRKIGLFLLLFDDVLQNMIQYSNLFFPGPRELEHFL